MIRNILASFFMFCICGSASHAEISAELFYRTCMPNSQDEVCLGYISGVVAGLQYGKAASDGGTRYCIPADVGYLQALLISRKFIESHPETMNTALGKDVAATISVALTHAFPCKNR
jgi:hypothetical protein